MRGSISADKGDDRQPPDYEPASRRTASAVIPIGLKRHDQRDLSARKSRAAIGILYQPGIAERGNEIPANRKDCLSAIDSRVPLTSVLPGPPGDRPHRSSYSQDTQEARSGRKNDRLVG